MSNEPRVCQRHCGHDPSFYRVNEDPRAVGENKRGPMCWHEDEDGFCGHRCDFSLHVPDDKHEFTASEGETRCWHPIGSNLLSCNQPRDAEIHTVGSPRHAFTVRAGEFPVTYCCFVKGDAGYCGQPPSAPIHLSDDIVNDHRVQFDSLAQPDAPQLERESEAPKTLKLDICCFCLVPRLHNNFSNNCPTCGKKLHDTAEYIRFDVAARSEGEAWRDLASIPRDGSEVLLLRLNPPSFSPIWIGRSDRNPSVEYVWLTAKGEAPFSDFDGWLPLPLATSTPSGDEVERADTRVEKYMRGWIAGQADGAKSWCPMIEQFCKDLNVAHNELLKAQGVNESEFDKYDWPEWSPQANSIRWAEDLLKKKLAKTDHWTLYPTVREFVGKEKV